MHYAYRWVDPSAKTFNQMSKMHPEHGIVTSKQMDESEKNYKSKIAKDYEKHSSMTEDELVQHAKEHYDRFNERKTIPLPIKDKEGNISFEDREIWARNANKPHLLQEEHPDMVPSRDLTSEQQREYKTKIKLNSDRYIKENKPDRHGQRREKSKEYLKQYYEKNKDTMADSRKEYYENNKKSKWGVDLDDDYKSDLDEYYEELKQFNMTPDYQEQLWEHLDGISDTKGRNLQPKEKEKAERKWLDTMFGHKAHRPKPDPYQREPIGKDTQRPEANVKPSSEDGDFHFKRRAVTDEDGNTKYVGMWVNRQTGEVEDEFEYEGNPNRPVFRKYDHPNKDNYSDEEWADMEDRRQRRVEARKKVALKLTSKRVKEGELTKDQAVKELKKIYKEIEQGTTGVKQSRNRSTLTDEERSERAKQSALKQREQRAKEREEMREHAKKDSEKVVQEDRERLADVIKEQDTDDNLESHIPGVTNKDYRWFMNKIKPWEGDVQEGHVMALLPIKAEGGAVLEERPLPANARGLPNMNRAEEMYSDYANPTWISYKGTAVDINGRMKNVYSKIRKHQGGLLGGKDAPNPVKDTQSTSTSNTHDRSQSVNEFRSKMSVDQQMQLRTLTKRSVRKQEKEIGRKLTPTEVTFIEDNYIKDNWLGKSQSLYIDLEKGRLNTAHLVRKPIQVRGKNGKIHTRMAWVKPWEASTGHGVRAIHSREDLKQAKEDGVHLHPHTRDAMKHQGITTPDHLEHAINHKHPLYLPETLHSAIAASVREDANHIAHGATSYDRTHHMVSGEIDDDLEDFELDDLEDDDLDDWDDDALDDVLEGEGTHHSPEDEDHPGRRVMRAIMNHEVLWDQLSQTDLDALAELGIMEESDITGSNPHNAVTSVQRMVQQRTKREGKRKVNVREQIQGLDMDEVMSMGKPIHEHEKIHELDKADIKDVLGDISLEGLEHVFSCPKGRFTAKLKFGIDDIGSDEGESGMGMALTFYNSDGKYAGHTTRDLSRDPDGTYQVYNSILSLDDGAQNLGIASTIYKRSEQLWSYLAGEGNKVEINVYANISIGKYAWAGKDKGFDFTGPWVRDNVASQFKEFIKHNDLDMNETLKECGYNSLDEIQHAWQFAELDDGYDYNLDMHNIEDVKGTGHLGKAFMLTSMSSWSGVKIIDPHGRQRQDMIDRAVDEHLALTAQNNDYTDLEDHVDLRHLPEYDEDMDDDRRSMLAEGIANNYRDTAATRYADGYELLDAVRGHIDDHRLSDRMVGDILNRIILTGEGEAVDNANHALGILRRE